jgi:SAM-dependent methyltransferase
MEFKIVHGRVGTDIWANTRLKILNKLVKGENNIILDLGCGKGYVGSTLSERNKVVFAEIDPSLIKDVKGMRVILDATKIPFKKNTFDYVICADVLEHIKEDRKVLENIYSILKNGGNAIIALPAYSKFYGHHDKLLNHYRRYDKKSFEKLAKGIGFKIKSARYTCSLLFFPWFINQIIFKSNKAYIGKSKIEKKLIPLLNFASWLEAKIRLPFGINLQFVLGK